MPVDQPPAIIYQMQVNELCADVLKRYPISAPLRFVVGDQVVVKCQANSPEPETTLVFNTPEQAATWIVTGHTKLQRSD